MWLFKEVADFSVGRITSRVVTANTLNTTLSPFICLICLMSNSLSLSLSFFPRYDGNSLLSSIECYDPVLDAWEVVTSMATQRCDAGVCVLREKWSLQRTKETRWWKQQDRQLDWRCPWSRSPHGDNCETGILREISAAVWAGQPSEDTTEIHPRHGFKRGPRDTHHRVHDSHQWYLLLSLPMRLFFFSRLSSKCNTFLLT